MLEIKTNPLFQGFAYAAAAALLFGVSTPLAKMLLGQASPWMLAGLLYLGSGIGLAAYLFAKRCQQTRPAPEAMLAGTDWMWLGAVVLFGGVIGPVLLMYGLLSCTAASSSLLLNLEGVFTVLIAWLVLKENFDKQTAIGMALITSGCVFLSWMGGIGSNNGWGVVLIAGACLSWAIDNNLTRKLSANDPVLVAIFKGCIAGLINIAIAINLGAKLPATARILSIAVIGFFGYGLSLVAFILALRFVGTARTAAVFSTAPFFGAAFAIVAFGERITSQLLVASLLTGTGLVLYLTERHRHNHQHSWLVHEHSHAHDSHHLHEHGCAMPLTEPHYHLHEHVALAHSHIHYPDIHHRHSHAPNDSITARAL